MTPIPFSAGNTLSTRARIQEPGATGRLVPVTTGTVSVFIVASDAETIHEVDPTLTAAHASLVGSAEYNTSLREWIVTVPGTVLDATILADLFVGEGKPTPYLVIAMAGAIRSIAELVYRPSAAAVVR